MTTPADAFLAEMESRAKALSKAFDEVHLQRQFLLKLTHHQIKTNLIAKRVDPDEAGNTASRIIADIGQASRKISEAIIESEVTLDVIEHAVANAIATHQQFKRATGV